MKNKFVFGDYVALKVFQDLGGEYGQIIKFDSDKQMYLMIYFVDQLTPREAWHWSYVKEDDIEKTEVYNLFKNEPLFSFDVILDDYNYFEIYNEDYFLAKKYYDKEINRDEYWRLVRNALINRF